LLAQVDCEPTARALEALETAPGMDVRDLIAFRKLMEHGRRAKLRATRQNEHGGYDYPRHFVNDSQLESHFSGVATFAFCLCDDRGRSSLLCLDIDERAHNKLPDIARALERRGLIEASIATTGSTYERAKVLVFFERRYAASSLQREARSIYDEAKAVGRWSLEHEASAVQFFPTSGEGGLVRIGGRNRKPGRGATKCDGFLSVWAEKRSFADVVPCRQLRPDADWHPVAPARQGVWVENLLTRGVSYRDGSARVFSSLTRLAHEAQRLGIGPRGYLGWCDRVLASSSAMQGPSPSGDARSERTWQRKCDAAWAVALKSRGDTFRNPGRDPKGANGMYQTKAAELKECIIVRFVRDYARAKGIRADCICVSIRTIAEHLGCATAKAQRLRKAAITARRIVIHDPGTAGPHGLPALIGVVEDSESTEDVRERCYDRENMRARRRAHERYAAKIAMSKAMQKAVKGEHP
jgi:hypothetical protein